ncbi:MAG TPA: UPF0280 family protein [Thermoguttaceae bacterium]|nr:UPF0280 family protein [Thermoguttaceae bacterium]
MTRERTYRTFQHKEAVFRICCDRLDAVTAEIVRQRRILEEYIERHPAFRRALEPLSPHPDAPEIATRMARAAQSVGVGPMAAVAGAMAEIAAEAGLGAGASEAIIENGGDIYLETVEPVTIGLHTGTTTLADRLAFALDAEQTPIAICSSSGKMGHSLSLGRCDLAVVVAKDTALADAAATLAANLVTAVDQIDPTLDRIAAIEGVDGVLIVKDDRIGLAGSLPNLVKLG